MPFELKRRVRLVAITAMVALLLYAALGFFWVPHLVRGQIEEFSARHWQRRPALGEISFNPFTLALELRGFAFQDSRQEPLVSFDRLLVNLDISSLWRRGLSLHAIELDAPAARAVVRADGSLNLDELGAPFAGASEAAPDDTEPARLFIDRLQIGDGAFEFEDHARSVPFKARLTPVNFTLLDFSTTGDSGNNYSLVAQSTAGEKFRWSGSFGLTPLSSRGQFELTDVQARTLWSYLQESLGFEISAGVVGVSGDYHFASTEPDLTFQVGVSRVDVRDLKLRPRGGDTDAVELRELAVAAARVDLTRRTADVASIKLAGGEVRVTRGTDGAVDLLALLEAPAHADPSAPTPGRHGNVPAAAADSRAWTLNVPDVVVQDLRVTARDEFVKPAAAFTLAPLNLHLRGFSTAPGQSLDLDASLALESGGRLAIQGRGVPADQTFSGKLALEDFSLAAMQPYVGTYTQMTVLGGVLDAELEANYQPDAWRVTGRLDCARLHTVDDALREDFIKWERLALDGIEYRGGGQESLRIATISARAPYLRLIIAPDQTTNIGKVLTRPANAPGPVQSVRGRTAPTGASGPMAISIGKVRVENGSANFADFWITPNYAVSLQQLTGSISGLSSRKDSRARVDLAGRIDRYAPVQIAGELNLLSASLFTDLRVKFDGVELTSVTPYSGRFAGYRIEKGKLSVNVRYLVENRRLDAEQRFIIDQLTLGERVDSPDAVKLPLKLAVALLKDRNGVIDLGLPVTGSLDDPKFRIGPIVWKAFVNLLSGIATSPFRLLGGMFGGGDEVNLVDFEPGAAALDAAASAKLAALSKALRERPQLALDVPATYAPDADYPRLAAEQIETRLRALASSRKEPVAENDPAGRFELLLALYRTERAGATLPPAALALQQVRARERSPAALDEANRELETALRPAMAALEPALQALAQQRARAIQDALLASGEIEPGRVFMLAPTAAPAAGDKVRIGLGLRQ